MTGSSSTRGLHLRRTVWHYLPALLSAIPVLVIPALEWLPGIPKGWRPWVILGSLCLAAIGIVWSGLRSTRLDELRSENEALRSSIMQSEPEYFLRQIAGPLFRDGAWRLTVLKKTYDLDGTQNERLERLASASSDLDHVTRGPAIIPIHLGTQFAHIFTSNLADARYRLAEESGSFPGDTLSPEWTDWRDQIFGDGAIVDDSSSFRARKLAWFAAQDPKTTKVFVVVAESATEQGVSFDLLNHPLTPSWLFFVAHLADLRSAVSQ